MAKILSKTGILKNNTILAWHVTQSIDALTGIDDYDITISGSLEVTGSVNITPTQASTGTNVLTVDSVGKIYKTGSYGGGGGGGGSSLWYDGTTYLSSSLPINVEGNITASGDISASGTVFGTNFNLKNNDQTLGYSGNKILFADDVTNWTEIEIGRTGTNTQQISLFGQITSSGNISASGDLHFNSSLSSNTGYKTLVYDTSTGKVHYTGSYGGGGGSSLWYDGTTYLSSSKDIQITGSLVVSASNLGGAVSAWKYKDLSNQTLLFGDGSYTYLSSNNVIAFRVNGPDRHTINEKGLVLNKGFYAANTNTLEVSGSTLLSGSLNVVGDDVTPGGQITASGNISSSGNVYGDSYYMDDQIISTNVGNDLRLADPSWDSVDINNTTLSLGGGSGNLQLTNITASGNISASGTYYGDGSDLTGIRIGILDVMGTSITPTTSQIDQMVVFASLSACEFKIPRNGVISYPIGCEFKVMNTGVGTTTITGSHPAVTYYRSGSVLNTGFDIEQYEVVTIKNIAANEWICYP
jgi:hypothetical protein